MGRPIPIQTRKAIVALKKAGLTNDQIKKRCEEDYGRTVCARTIRKIAEKYEENSTVANKKRTGRKPILNPLGKRAVRRIALNDNRLSLRRIAADYSRRGIKKVSKDTVARALASFNLYRYVAARKPLLTHAQKMARLNWALERADWPVAQWATVISSDEKLFRVTNHRKTEYVTRAPGERYQPECISYRPKSGPQVHVWGAIGWNGVGPLKLVDGNLNAQRYQQEILPGLEDFAPTLSAHPYNWMFMQDNAPPHRARTTLAYLQAHNVKLLDWPGNSPDLNPIEHVWAYVEGQLPPTLPKNAEEYLDRVRTVWESIPVERIRELISSMPRRLERVIKARGGPTRD